MIKKLFVITLILLPVLGLSSTRLRLEFPKDKVKQGSLEEGVLLLDKPDSHSFGFSKLQGRSLEGILYFHKLSPLIKKEGSEFYEAEVSLIFLKQPEGDSITVKDNGTDLTISFSGIEILPTQAEQQLIFEKFTIPKKESPLFWALGGLILLFLGFVTYAFYRKWQQKMNLNSHRRRLKNELIEVRSFEEIARVWEKKPLFLKEFPHLETSFKELEKTLFLYLFKPHQTEEEKERVQKAYRHFIRDIEGGLHGI